MGGSGGALGELWEAQGQLWEALAELREALGELWEGLYIQKLPINRPSGRYVLLYSVLYYTILYYTKFLTGEWLCCAGAGSPSSMQRVPLASIAQLNSASSSGQLS